ncbi:hypothetical protein N7486_008040 [Penicillium sp. IBT 16267x]|nr:hypothetical protein N7486_008040 [Penicillium sp. IBT 16267x]
MAPVEFNYFPTEVLILIAEYVYDVKTYMEDAHNRAEYAFNCAQLNCAELKRQNALYNFCLVSHQWYSVGVELLYREPSISDGNRFVKFTQTVCPPIKTKNKTKSDMASMIHDLSLGQLVHQSSNSVTARLLSKASKNLVTFTAPRVSFSLNGLAALSKCQNLKYLDLSRVGDASLTFPQLKKAISKLVNLRTLHLPIYIPLTRTLPTTGPWPSSLDSMILGGHIDPKIMESFDWPPHVIELTLSKCKNVTVSLLHNILSNDNFQHSLTLFTVDVDCDVSRVELNESTSALSDLHVLEHIQVPTGLIWPLLLIDDEMPALSIRSLGLTEDIGPYGVLYPIHPHFCEDITKSLKSGPLSDLWHLTAPSSLLEHYGVDPRELDELVTSHLDDVDDKELDEWGPYFGFQVSE